MRDKKQTILIVVAIAVLVAALVATIIPVVRASSENGPDFSATGSLEFDAAVGQDM